LQKDILHKDFADIMCILPFVAAVNDVDDLALLLG
jgi:hypothetical protein